MRIRRLLALPFLLGTIWVLGAACSSGGDALADGDSGVDADGGFSDGDAVDDAGVDGDAENPPDGGDGDDDGGTAQPSFENIAPSGGYPSSFSFHPTDPNTIFAGIDDSGGLYVSQDRGASWENLPLGRQNWSAWKVRIYPGDPDVITICDCYGHGVLRSIDGGASWQERNNGLTLQNPHRLVRALALDPTDPQVLYAGTGDGVYKSTDGANSWQKASAGLAADLQVYTLAIDPSQPQRLFAGLEGGGIYRSLNGAANWSEVGDVYPDLDSLEFWDLVVSPSDPSRVLAAAGNRVLHSTDGGDSWNPIAEQHLDGAQGIPIGVAAAFDPTDAKLIYLGTFRFGGGNLRLRSDDGGVTFTDITAGLEHEAVFRIRVSPHDSDLVLVGLVGDGIERSQDSGDTWLRHSGPPSVATAPGAFAVARSDPGRIYFQGSPTAVRSDNGGETWLRLEAPVSWIWQVAIAPDNPDFILIAPYFGFYTGLYRSQDGGLSWSPLGPDGIAVMSILFDSNDPNLVYAGAWLPAGGPFGVYRSMNKGDSFIQLTPDSWHDTIAVLDLEEHPNEAGELLIATSDGLYASTSSQSVFGKVALDGQMLFSLAVSTNGLWVAGGQGAVYISKDGGSTWNTHAFPDCQLWAVLIDPDRPNRILVGVSAVDADFTSTSAPGLYLSEDRGQTFSELTADLLPADQIYRLALDGSAPDTYLVSVYSGAGGLYRVHIP